MAGPPDEGIFKYERDWVPRERRESEDRYGTAVVGETRVATPRVVRGACQRGFYYLVENFLFYKTKQLQHYTACFNNKIKPYER